MCIEFSIYVMKNLSGTHSISGCKNSFAIIVKTIYTLNSLRTYKKRILPIIIFVFSISAAGFNFHQIFNRSFFPLNVYHLNPILSR